MEIIMQTSKQDKMDAQIAVVKGTLKFERGGPLRDILSYHVKLAKKYSIGGQKVRASDFRTIWVRYSCHDVYTPCTFATSHSLSMIEQFVLQAYGSAAMDGVKAIHLSRANLKLIKEEFPVFTNGEDIIINHSFEDGKWVVGEVPAIMGDRLCFWCFAPNALDKCSKCQASRYCGPECQKAHWLDHKQYCGKGE